MSEPTTPDAEGAAAPADEPIAVAEAIPPAPDGFAPEGYARPATRRAPSERSMGSLVASGPSIVGVSGSMRARDVSRPRAADLERAERDVVLKQRPFEPAAGSRPVPGRRPSAPTSAPAPAPAPGPTEPHRGESPAAQ